MANAKSLSDIPGFVHVDPRRADSHPRIILFNYVDLSPGAERVFRHNYIVITFEHGIKFFLDVAGHQSGFSRVLYTLRRFEKEVLQTRENVVLVGVPEIMNRAIELAWLSPPGTDKDRWKRLMEFSFDSWA
jgi:hypothetical protein